MGLIHQAHGLCRAQTGPRPQVSGSPYSRVGDAPWRAMACQAHLAWGSEHQDSNTSVLSSELFTGNASLVILSSQKPPARCQTLLPLSKFIWDRHGVVAMLGWRPAAGLLGQGSARWAVALESGSRGKARLQRHPPPPSQPHPPRHGQIALQALSSIQCELYQLQSGPSSHFTTVLWGRWAFLPFSKC